MESGWWWCEAVGSVVRREDGWYGSQSGYSGVICGITVGPFTSAKVAMQAIEEALV